MRVLQDFQRRLSVALTRGVMQDARDFHLTVSAAFLLSQFSQWVKLAKLAVL